MSKSNFYFEMEGVYESFKPLFSLNMGLMGESMH